MWLWLKNSVVTFLYSDKLNGAESKSDRQETCGAPCHVVRVKKGTHRLALRGMAQLGLRHTEPLQPPGNSVSEGEDVRNPTHNHATRWSVNTTGPLAFMPRSSTDRGGYPEAMWPFCSGTMCKYVMNR